MVALFLSRASHPVVAHTVRRRRPRCGDEWECINKWTHEKFFSGSKTNIQYARGRTKSSGGVGERFYVCARVGGVCLYIYIHYYDGWSAKKGGGTGQNGYYSVIYIFFLSSRFDWLPGHGVIVVLSTPPPDPDPFGAYDWAEFNITVALQFTWQVVIVVGVVSGQEGEG